MLLAPVVDVSCDVSRAPAGSRALRLSFSHVILYEFRFFVFLRLSYNTGNVNNCFSDRFNLYKDVHFKNDVVRIR